MQLVPAAMGISADHAPDAQRWNEDPPMQFHAPSSVQGVPAANAEPPPEPGVPVPAGAPDACVLVALDGFVLVARVVGSVPAGAVLLSPTVTKTPPPLERDNCEQVFTCRGASHGSGNKFV